MRKKARERRGSNLASVLLVVAGGLASGIALAQGMGTTESGLLSEYGQLDAKLGSAPGPYALNVTLSYTELSGNADASSLVPGLAFQKFWKNDWGVIVEGSAMRSTSSGITVAESFTLDMAFVRTLSKNYRVVLLDEWHRDVFKGLENRNFLSLAFLWKALNQKKWALTVHGGPGWHHEEFTTTVPDEDHLVGVLELDNVFSLSSTTLAKLNLTYYEDFDESQNYRFDADASLTTRINSIFSVSLSYQLKFDNKPISQSTDTLFMAGLNLTLSGKGKSAAGRGTKKSAGGAKPRAATHLAGVGPVPGSAALRRPRHRPRPRPDGS